MKHAETDRAWVRVCCDEQSPWRIVIEDRGVGSSKIAKVGTDAGQSTLGMSSFLHRIDRIGGTMEVDSQTDEGTRIALTIPLE